MPQIPPQLQTEKLRFIRVGANSKSPIDEGWTVSAHYAYNDPVLIEHLSKGGNYGVKTGNGLTVIDCDEPELIDITRASLPATFTVKTGTGMIHLYYWCDLPKKIIFKKGDKHMGEAQALGQQVVGPTSKHPNGNLYEVINDAPIAELDVSEMKAVLSDYFEEETERPRNGCGYENDPVLNEIKSKVRITDVLRYYGIKTNTNPTRCPMHEHKGAKCFSFNDDKAVWHCFHADCGRAGNVFHLIMEKEGIKFPEAYKKAAEIGGVDVSKLTALVQIADREGNIISDEVAASKISQELMSELVMADDKEAKKKIMMRYQSRVYEYLLKRYRFVTLLNGASPDYWVYRDGVYVEEGERIIRTFVEMAYGQMCNNHITQEIIGHIQRRTLKSEKEFKEEDKRYICVKNGIYDLVETVILPHTPEKIFFNKLPITYMPTADCPEIKKFMGEVLDKNDVPVMQEIIGYCLWREYAFQNVFFLSGSGANGKTVVSKIIKGMLGDDNISSVSMQQIADNRFMILRLRNSLVNINPDISDKALDDITLIKALTGGDLVTGENKGKDPITFVNHAKLIFGANQMPLVKDNTDAWFRRIIILNFGNKYYPPIDYAAHKGEANVYEADPHLERKLLTENELSGLFNYALEGLKRLLKQGQFSNPKTFETRKREFLSKSDNFRIFCEEKIEGGTFEDFIPKQELRLKYLAWCRENNVRNPISENIVKNSLTDHYGVGSVKKAAKDEDDRVMVWTGIKWRGVEEKPPKASPPSTETPKIGDFVPPVEEGEPLTTPLGTLSKTHIVDNREGESSPPSPSEKGFNYEITEVDVGDEELDGYLPPEKRPKFTY